MFGESMGLPVMHSDDWDAFSRWLHAISTDEVWTLNQLVGLYEQKHSPIRWFYAQPITYHCVYTEPNDYELAQDWAGGVIYMTDDPCSETLGDCVELPMMHIDDWKSFADWIEGFETDDAWTLEKLVRAYEQKHSPIRWFHKDNQ